MATDFDRDDRLQRLLRETLRNPTASGVCPDAAALAAWAEGALTPDETAAIDMHLSACARCREMASTLSAISEAEAAPAVVVPFTPRANGRWKMIVGAMGAVAASALIWIAVRDEAPRLDTKSASNRAESPQPSATGGRAPATQAEGTTPRQNESANALLEQQGQQGQRALAASPPEAKLARENPVRAAELAQRSLKPSAAPADLPLQRTEPPPPAVMPPPPAAIAPPPTPVPTTTTATAGAARSSTVTGLPQSSLNISLDNVKPADPSRSTETFFTTSIVAEFVVGADLLTLQEKGIVATADTFRAGGGAGRGGGGGGGRGGGAAGGNASGGAAAAQTTAGVAAPPAEPARWRLRAPAPPATSITAVERSNDAGATWQRVEIPATPTLTSGSAPTNTVCWLVGYGGTVLLSTDGKTFRQVTKPTQVDLASVRATDARSATVRTAGGQAFFTNDGGATWTAR